MKKRTIYSWMLSLSLLAGSITLNSCRDTFTEEQVLKEQQTIDLAITAFDKYENKGLAGATVSFQQDGQKLEQTTNEMGVANFGDVKIGSNLVVTITKDGFATTRQTLSTMVDNFRVSQLSKTADMYALDGISTAIIRGKAEIETDVTNDKPETIPANTPIEAYLKLDGPNGVNEISIKGQVDANGMYSLKVPATKEGLDYKLIFPTLELDQKIAKHGNEGDKPFPLVEPSIETIKTVYDPVTNNPENFGFTPTTVVPNNVLPVYAIIEAPNNPNALRKTQAVAGRVTVNANGEITGIDISNSGEGYQGTVKIEVKSLFNGSGVEVELMANAFGFVNTPLVKKGGSGYPTAIEANHNNAKAPAMISAQKVKSGDIKIVNVDYGTGTSRAKGIK